MVCLSLSNWSTDYILLVGILLVEVLGNYNQKRCGLQRCVKIGIVPPFRQRNPFDPLFLLLKYHAPEVVFNALVNPLCLPVTLGVVCRT